MKAVRRTGGVGGAVRGAGQTGVGQRGERDCGGGGYFKGVGGGVLGGREASRN